MCFCCVLVTAKICGNKGDLSNRKRENSSSSFQRMEAAFGDNQVFISEGTILNSAEFSPKDFAAALPSRARNAV